MTLFPRVTPRPSGTPPRRRRARCTTVRLQRRKRQGPKEKVYRTEPKNRPGAIENAVPRQKRTQTKPLSRDQNLPGAPKPTLVGYSTVTLLAKFRRFDVPAGGSPTFSAEAPGGAQRGRHNLYWLSPVAKCVKPVARIVVKGGVMAQATDFSTAGLAERTRS